MNTWEIVALPQGDEIMKNGKVADTREAERILNNHEKLVDALREIVEAEVKITYDPHEMFVRQHEAHQKARALLVALDGEMG